MPSVRQAICWVVTTGVVGMENQALGLAEALGLTPVVKRIALRPPFTQLAPFLRKGLSRAFSESGDPLAPPWPDLLIASGRAGALACLHARKESGQDGRRKTFTVYIQNPVIDPARFGLVAVPRHDGLLGENVVTTRGALHRVTPARLKEEAEKFLPSLSHLPRPLIAVLIGGPNAVYRFGPEEAAAIADQLARAAQTTGAGLLITTSRRTGANNIAILRQKLQDIPHVLWTGEGLNPHYAFLGLADAFLVTADSVNMTSEACSTGKPVHVIALPGGSRKFRLFHQTLRDDGLTRPFKGVFETWTPTPLNDVALVAARVKEEMGSLIL